MEVNRKWAEGSLAVFPMISLDSVLNQKAITFSKIKKNNNFIAIDLFFYCFKKADLDYTDAVSTNQNFHKWFQ